MNKAFNDFFAVSTIMIDTELYRSRIGCFQPHQKKKKSHDKIISKLFMKMAVYAIVVQMVLIIAGDIESNPGPQNNSSMTAENEVDIYSSPPSQASDMCDADVVMCICCLRCTPKYGGVQFNPQNYDFDNDVVCRALSRENFVTSPGELEYLCKSCHQQLKIRDDSGPKMPRLAAANDHTPEVITCSCCHRQVSRRQSILFKKKNYVWENSIVKQALGNESDHASEEEKFMCRSCDRNLRNNATPRMPRSHVANNKRKLFHQNACADDRCDGQGDIASSDIQTMRSRLQYSDMTVDINSDQTNEIADQSEVNLNFWDDDDDDDAMDIITTDSTELHTTCERNDTTESVGGNYYCTCCHRSGVRKTFVMFKEGKYNSENVVVKKALSYRLITDIDSKEYICKTCHNNLRRNDPKMPQKAVAKIKSRAADRFLKACESLPEFVCTCCHRLLFRKTVIVFTENNYNMNNDTVKRALALEYRYKSQCHNEEYICVTCNYNLRKEKPKMPAQAIANGLGLPDIPPELFGLNEIERRLISLRIPFLKIMALHRAGSHFRVNGPCVNVPSTISKLCNLLPRLPDEAQLIPMKLKRKIVYKGYHMSGHIRKDVVMNAVKWLKENNEYYKDIELNDMWDEEWMATELGSVLVEGEESVIPEEPNNENPTDNLSPDDEREEKELKEDQAAADRHAEICGQPFSSTLQLKNVEDAVYSVAPGEDNTPKYILLDPDFEVLAFPDLFPRGTGGYETDAKRETDLSLRRYYQQRILNVDGRFARNIEYIACAQYSTELKQLKGDAGIALKLTRGRCIRGQSVNAGMLKNASVVQDLIRTEHAYKFLKNIRGSPAYWQHQLYEVLAMIRSLGIPTWFLTLSAADLHWPEMIQATMRQYGVVITKEEVAQMDWQTKSDKLQSNPVTGVQVFQHRVEAFFSEYLLSKDNPVGDIHDHVIKIEFQERGTPHAHCLLWARNAPRIDVDSDEEVCKYIDEHISGVVPNDDEELKELILRLETHSHSAYCRRNSSCRFGFPKAPSPETLIARPPEDELNREEIIKHSREILGKVHDALDSDRELSLEDVLKKANVTTEKYTESLKVSKNGKNIILKRSPTDTFTNGCNHEILRIWQANIDFQYVIDAYSTVMYVISYMMKSEKAMGEVLKRVAKECRHEDIALQLKKIGNAFLGNRVVGMPESVMRLNSMWLIKKSRKVIYVNGATKEDRVSLPKIGKDLEIMADEDEDIFMTSIHDRYAARPDNLSDMCLACFAVNYDTTASNEEQSPTENEDIEISSQQDESSPVNRRNETIQLKNGLGTMRKRRREAIFRTHRYNVMKDREKYFHAQLLLYYPWRFETEIKGDYSTYEDHYNDVKEAIHHNSQHFEHHAEHLDSAFDELAENGPPESIWDSVAPAIEEENAAARAEGYYAIRNLEDEDLADHNDMMLAQGNEGGGDADSNKTSALSLQYMKEAQKDIMTPTEYRRCLRSLNADQLQIIMYNRAWCKDAIRKAMKGESVKPYKIFLSGPGGTGKSHVINLIRRDLIYFFRMIREDPYPNTQFEDDKPLVLLTAPTGSAAFQISGLTIHSALQLSSNGRHLSYEKKAILVNRLSQLKLLVTDEISMVGSPQLEDINSRLCMIHGSPDASSHNFGGVSILAVGDLYQLPPVKSCAIYKRPNVIREPGDLAPLPWHDFELHELTQSMRQKDIEFSKVLNVIRVKVPESGSHEDKVLQSRQLNLDEDDPSYPRHAMHVYARNVHAMTRNNKMLESLDGETYICNAKDREKDTHANIADVTFSNNPNKTGNLLNVLKLKIGARVMLTTNVDVTDGLTNGAMGTVTNLIFKNNNSNAPETVLVKFDGIQVGKNAIEHSMFRNIDKYAVPIKKVQATFPVNGKTSSCQGSRIQFPLYLSWAVSIHKCQGLTLDEIVVDMSRDKGPYQKGQAYVALSRVKTLDKLHIINYCRQQIKVSADVEKEMQRLRQNRIQPIKEPFIRNADCDSHLCISHLNVRNLNAKKEDIANDTDLQKADILCFSETHLSPADSLTSELIGIPNDRKIYRCDRNNNGGGILMCVNSKYNPELIETGNCGIEIIGIQVHVPHKLNVFCIYRPPTYNKKNFMEKLCNVLNDHCDLPTCIVGDFNENILDNVEKHIYKTFTGAGFIQHVNTPTRDSGSLLDHVYTHSIRDVNVDVYDCYYSDHDIVFCCFKIC